MPLVGGIFLVALVVGAEPGALLSLDWRELAATIVGSLLSRPLVLAAFLAALAVVVVGGSLFVFLVKGGTVACWCAASARPGRSSSRRCASTSFAGVGVLDRSVHRGGAARCSRASPGSASS